MRAYYPDVDGVRYRTDCSEFVAMVLHATPPGADAVGLIKIAREIRRRACGRATLSGRWGRADFSSAVIMSGPLPGAIITAGSLVH